MIRSLACLVLLGALLLPPAFAANPATLAQLKPGHPRLLVDEGTWEQLRQKQKTDADLAALLDGIEADARTVLSQPPDEYRKIGRRLLATSRSALHRVLTLSAAYRLTGDKAFLERAERDLLTIAAFPDWNPSHFLDVAEMTAAVAIGYDWLYADLTPDTRAKLRAALLDKALRLGLQTDAPFNKWQHAEYNWNQVCFGGLILGALAIADEEPDVAAEVLTLARANVWHGLKPYAPDGVYPEGPSYWGYGTSYTMLTIAALDTALRDSWGLAEAPGFLASAGTFLQTTGPTGLFFNFSDAGESGAFEPILFWFARRLHDPGLLQRPLAELHRISGASDRKRAFDHLSRFLPLVAIWWPQEASSAAPSLPLNWHGRGPNPIGVFRSSWTDPNALYLAFKGGAASVNHAHMDAGSFAFELDGVRWARDLGSQDYESLESKGVDLWNRKQNSQRWQVFRLNNRAHNTLTIDDQLLRVDGATDIVAFSAGGGDGKAIVDLTPAYAGQAATVRRGFRVRGNAEAWIQDELSGLRPNASVRWTFVTGAQIDIDAGGRRATLRESGRTLAVDLLSPAKAKFTSAPADPPPDGYDAPNPNRRFLLIETHAAEPALTIAVRLHRHGDPNLDAAPGIQPLSQWFTSASDRLQAAER